MVAFEYCAVDLNSLRRNQSDLDVLNDAGAEGWELISISAVNVALFKRPIQHAEPPEETIEYRATDLESLRRRMTEMTASAGFTLNEVLADEQTGEHEPLPKYRDPNNPANTWSGRGRMPRWLSQAIENGASKEDFITQWDFQKR